MINFSSKARFAYRVQILALVFLSLPLLGACRQEESTSLSCLPESRQLNDVVSLERIGSKSKKVTISDKLKELQARCDNDLLVDAKDQEIRFFNLQFCGGPNPPEEMVRRYREELKALEEQYTVIKMSCNPGGIPYP